MTDKVQKIREEVERLHNLLPVMDGDNISVDYANRICTTLEMYIESLQEEPVSEDLEDACEQLAENARKHKAETSSPFFSQTDYKQGVIDGAKWQKQQMKKDAIIATIESDLDPHGADYGNQKIICGWGELEAKRFKNGSKVKLIIIKEE